MVVDRGSERDNRWRHPDDYAGCAPARKAKNAQSPKNELAPHPGGSLESPQNARVWPVLPGRRHLRSVRGAADSADLAGVAGAATALRRRGAAPAGPGLLAND